MLGAMAEGERPEVEATRRGRAALLLRYVLLQLPDLALLGLLLVLLHRWLDLSPTLAWVIVGLWVVKDIALYPLVRRVYRQVPSRRDPGPGSVGVVRHRLDPAGYAAFKGELWRCVTRRGAGPVEAGARVRVVRVEGLTLVVEEPEGDHL